MSSYVVGELDALEAFEEFIDEDLSCESAEAFLDGLGYDSFQLRFSPSDAKHLILLHSFTDYSFSSAELSWIESAKNVFLYTLPDDKAFVFVEMNCGIDTYYRYCAAVVKVLNVAFPNDNVYFFKMDSYVAIGTARYSGTITVNSFAVTGLIDYDNAIRHLDLLRALCDGDYDEIASIVAYDSPQEAYSGRDFDKRIDLFDSNQFWGEMKSFYGIEAKKDDEGKNLAIDSFEFVNKELMGIAEPKADDLIDEEIWLVDDEDDDIEANITINLDNPYAEQDHSDSDFDEEFSKEAYKNAEIMLREMQNKKQEGDK